MRRRDALAQREARNLGLGQLEQRPQGRVRIDDPPAGEQGDTGRKVFEDPAREALGRARFAFDLDLLGHVLHDEEEPRRLVAVPSQNANEKPGVKVRSVVTGHHGPGLDAALAQAPSRELRQELFPRRRIEQQRRVTADDGVFVPAEQLPRPRRQPAQIPVGVGGDHPIAPRGVLERIERLVGVFGAGPFDAQILAEPVRRLGDRSERRPGVEVEARSYAAGAHLLEQQDDLLGVFVPAARERDHDRDGERRRQENDRHHEDDRRRELGENHGAHRSRGAGPAKW